MPNIYKCISYCNSIIHVTNLTWLNIMPLARPKAYCWELSSHIVVSEKTTPNSRFWTGPAKNRHECVPTYYASDTCLYRDYCSSS